MVAVASARWFLLPLWYELRGRQRDLLVLARYVASMPHEQSQKVLAEGPQLGERGGMERCANREN